MKKYTDALGREIEMPAPPQRIISLCPSLTQTLFDLGCGERVVGRTRFCIHPAQQVAQVTQVGGTKKVNFEKIAQLAPDIIFCVKEENTPEIVDTLAQQHTVFVWDVETLSAALQMITDLGEMTHTQGEAARIRYQIEESWGEFQGKIPQRKALYFIWKEPYMIVGEHTYIHEVLNYMGIENAGEIFSHRYPEITMEEIAAIKPELILLSSEPYPFQMHHIAAFQQIVPDAEVLIVNGEHFSWYGTGMLQAAPYLSSLCQKWQAPHL